MVAPSFDGGMQVAAVGRQYESVAASQANQVLGGTGATGDTLDALWIFPGSTAPGNVTVLDNAVAIWALGAVTLSSTLPIYVPLNVRSLNGGWKITTGAGVTVLAIGQWKE